jgi:hypothetical protein
MPLLNHRGDVIAGAGGVQGSLNGQPYPFQTFGGGAWLTDAEILVSVPDPSVEALLGTWNPSGPPSPVLMARGANDFAAGGGAFVAWLAGFGVWGDLETRLPPELVAQLPGAGTCGPHAVADDGTIGYVPDRMNGYGLRLVSPEGDIVEAPGILPWDVQVLGRGEAIYRGGAIGRLVPVPAVADAFAMRLVKLDDGEEWLVYWSDSVGFVAQLDGATDGYILGTSPTFFNHDATNVGGELVIAYSLTQGEGPNDIRVVPIDRSAARVPLVAAPPVVVIPSFSFAHPVVVAPFKDPSGDTSAPMEIVVNQTGQELDRPCFAAEDSLTWTGTLEGIYSEAADPAAAIALAAQYATRLVLAHDSTADWTPPAGLRAFDLPTRELYLSESETLDQSVARWTRQTQQLLADWPGSIGLIPMFYCMGGAPPDELFTVAQVCDGLAHLSAIVNLSPRIILIAPFAYLRANGMTGHPELLQAFANLLAEQQRVGLAALPPISTPPDPEPPEPPDPEPPDPQPEPQPPEPEEPTMLFIETKYDETNPNLATMKFNIIKNADGTESYSSVARLASADATEKQNPIYCVTDAGKDEWRASPGGTFESFKRVGTALVADRPWNGKENSYVRFCVEVQ